MPCPRSAASVRRASCAYPALNCPSAGSYSAHDSSIIATLTPRRDSSAARSGLVTSVPKANGATPVPVTGAGGTVGARLALGPVLGGLADADPALAPDG